MVKRSTEPRVVAGRNISGPERHNALRPRASMTRAFLQVKQRDGSGPRPDLGKELVRVTDFPRNLKWVRPISGAKKGRRLLPSAARACHRIESGAGSAPATSAYAASCRAPTNAGVVAPASLPVLPRRKGMSAPVRAWRKLSTRTRYPELPLFRIPESRPRHGFGDR